MFLDLTSYSDPALFLLRLAIASIFFMHGLMKIRNYKSVGPAFTVLGVVEVTSSVLMLTGIYTQVAAAAFIVVMFGALYMKIFNWKMKFIEDKATGWELDFILLFANIFILTFGSGSIALG